MDAHLLAQITGGTLKGSNQSFRAFSIDSRKVKNGDVFIPLKGSRFDGHHFIEDAFKRGAVGVISEKDIKPPSGKFVVKVSSTFEALRKIAKYKRESFKGKVIGVAGSAGKTTTKELITHLLSIKGKVFKTPGNLNSQVGLPFAIANASMDADFWVLELGASKLGEIKRLTELSLPHVKVITSLGEEHLEGFGNFENVVKGNGEIFEYWFEGNVAVIPDYAKRFYPFLRNFITFGEKGDIKGKIKEINLKGAYLLINGEEFFIPIPSLGILDNVLASFGVLSALGFNYRDFKKVLSAFRSEWGRMEVVDLPCMTIINDAYNSNPVSLRNAIDSLSLIKHPKKILILGDMLELGKYSRELHKEIGHTLNKKDFHLVVFIGKEMYHAYKVYGGNKFYFERKEDFKDFVQESENLIKNSLILIKGSRGMKLEEIIPVLREVCEE